MMGTWSRSTRGRSRSSSSSPTCPSGRRCTTHWCASWTHLGPATVRVTKSQVAFRRRTGFCWVWLPGMYLRNPGAQVVVSLALGHEDTSPRWKQVTQVGDRRWMHHLEVRSPDDVDGQLATWLAAAYALAA